MLDSGSQRSLLCKDILVGMKNTYKANLPVWPKLVTASEKPLTMVDHIEATVEIGQLHVKHNFLVVESLVAPAILGTDFLQSMGTLQSLQWLYTNMVVSCTTQRRPKR